MNTTLYILRRRPDEIPRALFHVSDPGMDIVFIENAASHAVSYDDLLKKIFEADRTVVI
jgi:hypothetical protein